MLVIGELLKQSERFLAEGLHPRILTDGFEIAKDKVLELLGNQSLFHFLFRLLEPLSLGSVV